MPWSCLCSSNKERYRPHISAPILNTTNETQKTQLVPTGKRATLIATAQNLEQKLDATDNVGLENGEFRDKRAKQLNKKQKEKCNKNKSKPLNAKKQTKSIGENEKISKDLMNVKFAFNGITPEPTNSAARNAKRTESLNKCNEELINVVSVETPTDLTSADNNNKSIIIITQNLQHPTNKATEKSEAGDYDKLPLIKIDAAQDDECNAEENGNSTTRNLYNSTTKSCTTTMECNSDDTVQPHASTSFTKSSESIPFIDESPNRTMHKNYHEARFITIEPRNVGSRVNNANIHNSAAVAPITIDDIVKEPQRFDKSVQILYQPDVAPLGDVHQFKKMDKLDGKLCQICHRSIYLINSMKCMGCGLVCHVDCAAIFKKNYDEQQQQQNQQQKQQQHIPKIQPYPRSPQKPDSSETILHYVTERILASVLPQRGNYDQSEHSERPHSETSREDKYEKELITMLEQKHGKDYKLFDLESCIATITLEKLCELCKHIDAWLGGGREKVIVLQDRGDRQRLGAAISAYLEYLEICGSTASRRNGTTLNEEARIQNAITKNWLDLDIFSMKKFLEELIGPLRIPSHRRYLNYFSGLLSGKIKMNSSPVYLKYVAVESPPSWLHYKADNAEWRSFIKVYDGLRCVFTSEIHVVPISTRRFIYQVDDLKLRGDVMIRCYQIVPSDRYGAERRELMSSTQFHTCAITNREMPFGRDELDYACDDPRFPEDHKVTFYFSNTASNDSDGYLFQSPLVTLEPATAITKYNSLEILDDDNQHTQGPLDGSLYATILKSPRTPTSTHSLKSQTLPNSNTPNLISPPPEFSNKRIDFTETHYSNGYLAASTTPSLRSSCSSTLSNRNTSTPIINKRASFNQDDIKISEHRDTSRPSSSLSSYTPDRYARSQSFTPNLGNYVPNTHQVKQIQSNEYTNSTVVNGNLHIASGDPNSYKEARESVRSPLTLSMDSGISSSGIVNRRIQGSSSSPSSFPSQTSPQEDRHRELDDILSDMLMTVQDIPDVNKNRYQTLTKAYNTSKSSSFGSLSSQQSRQSHQNHQQPQYHTDTIKRSQTCTTVQEELTPLQLSHPHNNNNNNYYKVDAYDTASTTTTLTPPPSESGRDTPLNIYDMHGQPPLPPHTSTSSSTSTLKRDNSFQASGKQQLAPNVIMDLQQHQQQSFVYPQQAWSNHNTVVVETTTTTQEIDGDQIPYHAREDSRPFTYGNPSGVQLSPTGTGMIKMQSGLSSPSLVRRTLSPTSSLKKTPARNDFEEMLRERREKVLSEKYTISDKNASNGVNSAGSYNGDNRRDHSASYDYKTAYNDNSKWFNTASPSMKAQTASPTAAATNGYRYPEPLKRSNTMDGGFGRSNSIDGTSGQTWLQLQQQKLRAKKEQQLADNRDYYTRTINTEIRSRPARSRSSASQRYDGYASDTGAFSYDEVDFQRPLHVQTPNRSSGRNYHTMTTTTTNTVQNERPFVAVKRAHQQAVKQQTPIGSPPVSPLSILSASPHGHIAQAQAQETTKNGLLSIADNNNSSSRNGHVRLVREESFSSYRSETEPEMSTAGSPRPETPAFPVTPRTPYGFNNGHSSPALPPKSPLTHRRFLNNSTWSLRSQKSSYSTSDWSKDLYSGNQNANIHQVMNQNETLSCYNTSRRNSTSSNAHSEPQEVAPHLVKFVRDSSKYWYKPSISRDEAVGLLRNAPPGTFIVRDSTTFANAYGLVVKVSHPPPGVVPKNGDELVRHFLVEPTTRGVRLKGCANEPVFTSLSALVYQHSITPLALPCKLIVPDRDIMPNMVQQSPAQQQLQTQGAACNVLYLFTCETESLTGPEAVKKAVSVLYGRKPLPIPTEVHFKVSHQGITLTDNSRQLFFRKHYPVKNISFCGLDPDDRRWSVRVEGDIPVVNKSIFAFVARRGPSSNDNQCHVFCELDPHQPATAIAAYAGKVIGAGTYAVSRNI